MGNKVLYRNFIGQSSAYIKSRYYITYFPIHASHPHKLCLLKWFDAAFVYSEIAVNAKRLFM